MARSLNLMRHSLEPSFRFDSDAAPLAAREEVSRELEKKETDQICV
jgi:hypothetical protein